MRGKESRTAKPATPSRRRPPRGQISDRAGYTTDKPVNVAKLPKGPGPGATSYSSREK